MWQRLGIQPFPFPYPLPEIHDAWRTSDVLGLSRAIAETGAWDRLPILADALEEAGCDRKQILNHLRRHRRSTRCGCIDGWSGRTSQTCVECGGGGRTRFHLVASHPPGQYPNRLGGCWEGTCWAVNLLLMEPQKVIAASVAYGALVGPYPVVNPGDFGGEVWAVFHATTHDPDGVVVEAAYALDAEDEFVESEFGADARITELDLRDYMTDPGEWSDTPRPPEYRCAFTDASCLPYDRESFQVDDLRDRSFRYYAPGLPYSGVAPRQYARIGPCDECGKVCIPVWDYPYYRGGTFCSEGCYIRHTEADRPCLVPG